MGHPGAGQFVDQDLKRRKGWFIGIMAHAGSRIPAGLHAACGRVVAGRCRARRTLPGKVVDFDTFTFEERLAEIRDASDEGDVLVGYSMGGRLGLHAALRDPDRYGGLVLIGTSAGIEDPASA